MPPSIVIRPLAQNDAGALWALRLTALESDPAAFAESAGEFRQTPRETIAARLFSGDPANFVLGAFDQSRLVGMAGLYREARQKFRHKARIWGMFVLPSHRGMGTGRALVAAALERARAIPGLTQVQLTVAVSQQAARGLYLSLGFRSFGLEPQAMLVDGQFIDDEYMYFPL